VDDKDIRQKYDPCTLGVETGPQTIIVRQVVAEQEAQKVLDIHVEVPRNKPAIEQIIDVFVKNLEINSVDVIHDKIIVRGEFEVKAVYVARLPNNPVHAIEIKHFRWTQDIDMPGARRGMDADASVIIEFVDYDVDEHTSAYKYRYEDMRDSNSNYKKFSKFENKKHNYNDECDDDDDDECADGHGHDDDCDDQNDDCDDHDDCDDDNHKHHHHHHHVCRDFDISIVLKIVGKVMTSREVQLSANTGTIPTVPKG
jgi:hypothetical protein